MSTANPYRQLPDRSFWSRSVARMDPAAVDPTEEAPFRLRPADRIATGGSCFAQHIARTLVREGFNYLVTEPGPEDRNYGVYPARFGNIYSTRQLLQLFQRAYGLFEPADGIWQREDGAFVDPFRPQVEPEGFATAEALLADRARHLAAVRAMFEGADVFIFTLGLTETWEAVADGAVVPLAPGVAGAPRDGAMGGAAYRFVNRPVSEMTADLTAFITKLRVLRPEVRIILTVSPVSLVATYEPRHVLVSTIYSKAALRVVAEEVSQSLPHVAYFPSFEIITGHHARYGTFESDLRSVRPEAVDRVMALFRNRFLTAEAPASGAPAPGMPASGTGAGAAATAPPVRVAPPAAPPSQPARAAAAGRPADSEEELAALYQVVCDEEALDP